MSMIDGKDLEEHKPKISEEARLEFAGMAWTFKETSHIEMDVVLAKAFAEVIDIVVNGGFDTVESYTQFVESTQDFHKD